MEFTTPDVPRGLTLLAVLVDLLQQSGRRPLWYRSGIRAVFLIRGFVQYGQSYPGDIDSGEPTATGRRRGPLPLPAFFPRGIELSAL